jgi:hypothetical protein
LEFIEELLDLADDQAALEETISSKGDQISPELIQMISSIMTQTMTGTDQEEGEPDSEREALLSKLNAVHGALLRYSMHQSFHQE